MEYKYLLSPCQIGSLKIKNRAIMAPMSAALANPDGTITDELLAYLTARAKGGVGLILTEYAYVQDSGKSSDHQISVADDGKTEGLKKMVDAVHAAGSRIGLQLQHGGRRSIEDVQSASPIPLDKTQPTPRVLTTEEVYQLINDFIAAAVRAKEAGFDLVEVHCAHGYLLNDFVSPHTNRRTDKFGGGVKGRTLAPCMIIRGIKAACGTDYPVSVRVSGDDMVEDGNLKRDSAEMAQLLEEAGADLINVSGGMLGVGYGIAPAAKQTGYNVEAAAEIKKVTNCKVAVAGRINEPEYCEEVLRAGDADFISIGRALFADPEFINKAAAGKEEEILPCVGCLQRCYGSYGHGGVYRSCMVNPFAMRETRFLMTPAEHKKKIIVVGAGPAGLEFSWIAAARGHEVTLYDRNAEPGGQFRIAAMPPHKQLLARAISYYYNMCRKYGVQLQFNTEVDADQIQNEGADAVVLATGGQPLVPRIPGLDQIEHVFGSDVLMGRKLKGNKVLVIGGGAQGAETADYLGELGYEAAVIEMRDGIALDDHEATRKLMMQRYQKNGVTSYTGCKVLHVYEDGVDYEKDGEVHTMRDYSDVILSIGVKSYNPLEEKLSGLVPELYVIGDALQAKNAVNALYVAVETATKI